MRKSTVFRCAAAAVLLSFSLTGCQLLPQEEEFPAAPVIYAYETGGYPTTTVFRGDLVLEDLVHARYIAASKESLSFPIGGQYIGKVYVEKGEQVKQGELLAELEMGDLPEKIATQEYILQVRNTEEKYIHRNWDLELSRLDSALAEYRRQFFEVQDLIKELKAWEKAEQEALNDAEQNVSSQPEGESDPAGETESAESVLPPRPTQLTMEQLQAQKSTLQAQIASVKETRSATNANYTQNLQNVRDSIYIEELRLKELQEAKRERQLYATIDGTVLYVRGVEPGQRSVEDELFVTVADMTNTAFVVEGPDAAYFPIGTEAEVKCKEKLQTVVAVDPAVLGLEESEQPEGEIAYLQLVQPDPTIENGENGTISVILDSREDVLYVKKTAIKRTADKTYVYVPNEAGLKVLQEVKIGIEAGNYVEIVSGLAEGDSVIEE